VITCTDTESYELWDAAMIVDSAAKIDCAMKGCYAYYSDRLCVLVSEDVCVPSMAIAHSVNCKIAVWSDKAVWCMLRRQKAGLGLRLSVGAIRIPPRTTTHLVVQLDNMRDENVTMLRGDRLLFLAREASDLVTHVRLE
jgi:hypothetical protein